MPYELRDIIEVDQEKIVQDATGDAIKQKRLRFTKETKDFTRTWAIDRERNNYLLSMPLTLPEESRDRPYYAFVKGSMYMVCTDGSFGPNVYFNEKTLPPEPLREEIQGEVRKAFRIYGRFGTGPKEHDPKILDIVFVTKEGI